MKFYETYVRQNNWFAPTQIFSTAHYERVYYPAGTPTGLLYVEKSRL